MDKEFMPFTPFHFGIATAIFALLSFVDPFSLFIGAIATDIEGITALFILPGNNLPLHGPLHSFTGAIFLGIVSGILSLIMMRMLKIKTLTLFSRKILFTKKNTLISGLIGSFSHILLDAPLYPEMKFFYPIEGNMLYGILGFSIPYILCVIAGIGGIILILIKISIRKENTAL